MAFDLLTMIITSVAVFILAIPVAISLFNLIVELWISYKDGVLTAAEAEKIQQKRNRLSRTFIRVLSVFGMKFPWMEELEKIE